jgi:hypothetical protein
MYSEWLSSVLRHVPVAASHSRTVLLRDADATSCPSGKNATALTDLEWPLSVLRQVPVATSYSCTILSRDTNVTSCPSGEKATALTQWEWPSSVLQQASQSSSFMISILTLSGTSSTKDCRIRLLSGANTSAEQNICSGASASTDWNRRTNRLASCKKLRTMLADGHLEVSTAPRQTMVRTYACKCLKAVK